MNNEKVPAAVFKVGDVVNSPEGLGKVMSVSNPVYLGREWKYSYGVKLNRNSKVYDFFQGELNK